MLRFQNPLRFSMIIRVLPWFIYSFAMAYLPDFSLGIFQIQTQEFLRRFIVRVECSSQSLSTGRYAIEIPTGITCNYMQIYMACTVLGKERIAVFFRLPALSIRRPNTKLSRIIIIINPSCRPRSHVLNATPASHETQHYRGSFLATVSMALHRAPVPSSQRSIAVP